MTVVFLPLKKLCVYKRSLRKNDHAVDRMAALIQEFGFRIPLLVRSNGEGFELIDGDLRLKAARKSEMTEVPVIVCDDWTDVQVKAFRLAVNRSATWATFNLELVSLELTELKNLNFDLSLTGFEGFEMDKLLRQDAIDESLPKPTDAIVSRREDLWVCDGHRILCSDSTSAECVARLLEAGIPTLMVTDPPYGTLTDPSWRERAGLGVQRQTGLVANDDRVDWTAAYKLFPGDVAYVWHAGVHAAEVAFGLNAAGFNIRSQIIWAKQHFALSRGDFHWQHEPCWYAVRNGKRSNWTGDRKQSTLWEVANLNPFGGGDEETLGHGTQKPVELMRRSIANNSKIGEVVYDPFLGSGTTLIAAEMTSRLCYALEIDPIYVDMIIRRWQKLSGKNAVLDGDGRTFEEISQQPTLQAEEV
jgi:DNA modification methylase